MTSSGGSSARSRGSSTVRYLENDDSGRLGTRYSRSPVRQRNVRYVASGSSLLAGECRVGARTDLAVLGPGEAVATEEVGEANLVVEERPRVAQRAA